MLKQGALFSHYTIDAVLGEGGMGIVYRAIDPSLDRVVGLKLLNEKFSHSAVYRANLSAEAKLAARIDSPHVVKIWEHSTFQDQPYIAMEYIDGIDLRSAARDKDFGYKLDVAKQVGRGIKDAHQAGLIHRDLKPENIKVTEIGAVKILDFGLAKVISTDSVDQQGDVEGTLHYLSPEQLSGQPLTFSCDQFSFGAILYELFTGVRPFEGEYAASIMYSILHEEPIPPCERKSDLPQWVNALVMTLMAKNPQGRFENISAALDFINSSQRGSNGASEAVPYSQAKQKVTVIDLKNLSGDVTWDYFCLGFTEDVIREISRRTDLIISAEPATSQTRDIQEMFKKCRSDFIITGSLMKWQESLRLQLSIYSSKENKLVAGETYEGAASKLFQLLFKAAEATSISLATITGVAPIPVDDYLKTDVSAYDYYLKGKSYYQTNTADDLKLAVKLYTKALEIEPNFALAHTGLSDVYTFQYMAFFDRTTERINQAKLEAITALKIDSALPEAHRSLGRYYMFTGDMANAEKCFYAAVEYNPKYAVGFRTLAWLKREGGDYESATQWAKKSLELAPTDLETLLLLSLISMDQRKFTVAVATLHRAIELGPDYGRAYYNLGVVYMKLGVFDLALENFQLAIKYQGDPNCYIDAGYIHILNKDFASAKTKFEESIKADCLLFVSHYYLGFLDQLEGSAHTSKEHFSHVIALTPDSTNGKASDQHIQVYRAMAFAGLGDNDKALTILNTIQSDAHINGEVLCNMARCYALLGQTAEASRALHQSFTAHAGPTEREVALDPHFAELSD
ncbi:MAG: protein kinase [candidate division Zixibacteria bacterium]|nr:protein kinase [candidate division Zixibacteria bacterium]